MRATLLAAVLLASCATPVESAPDDAAEAVVIGDACAADIDCNPDPGGMNGTDLLCVGGVCLGTEGAPCDDASARGDRSQCINNTACFQCLPELGDLYCYYPDLAFCAPFGDVCDDMSCSADRPDWCTEPPVLPEQGCP